MQRVGSYFGLGILCHDRAVLVIQVSQCKSLFWKIVKKCFLGFQVIFKCLVVIQMITGNVCENTTGKSQTTDTFLYYRV